MFRHGFFLRFVAALVMVGLLVAGGAGLYRLGWVQGYQTGAVTAAAPASGQGTGSAQNGSQVAPPAPYYYGPWMYGPRFGFFPFFPFFGIGFFLIVFLLIGGVFRMLAFRRWAGGPGMHAHWREEAEKEWRERHSKPEEPAKE
jgi:hypothetical protein